MRKARAHFQFMCSGYGLKHHWAAFVSIFERMTVIHSSFLSLILPNQAWEIVCFPITFGKGSL